MKNQSVIFTENRSIFYLLIYFYLAETRKSRELKLKNKI